ncbi:hypothetical protein ACC756_07280 [Rhizobium ruizarguesonis]
MFALARSAILDKETEFECFVVRDLENNQAAISSTFQYGAGKGRVRESDRRNSHREAVWRSGSTFHRNRNHGGGHGSHKSCHEGPQKGAVMIVPKEYPSLESPCWNRSKTTPIDRETAWALYRANWKFIYQDDLTAEERALIENLEVEFGNGERLLGTDGPPPGFARMITPEQAAEIPDTDLVLLERRMEAGVLPYRQADGRITFNLVDVLELKKEEDVANAALLEASRLMEGVGEREITPEQAAAILGIDLVLLERRVRAEKLVKHEVDGKVTFSFCGRDGLKRRSRTSSAP